MFFYGTQTSEWMLLGWGEPIQLAWGEPIQLALGGFGSAAGVEVKGVQEMRERSA